MVYLIGSVPCQVNYFANNNNGCEMVSLFW